ncbi:MAG: polysaccharide biosynthesis C-terminal domain-containing protein [Candidatus Caldarchaeum sp.]|nr:polysaccharide biosynthesis C-terminal domain-containing protein [Candidatus Caldarchaeum sp.]
MSRGIRVRFSGLMMFIGNLVTLVTGLVFNVLIARNLEPAALGVWFFIGSVIPYFQVLEKAIPYWAGRDIPRGLGVGKTTVVFNLLLSVPVTIVFLLISDVLAAVIDARRSAVLMAALLLPTHYVVAALTAVTYSTEPHKLSLRTAIIDGVKIPLASVLLPYGLEGVILSVIAGNLVYVLYLYRVSKKYLVDKFSREWVKKALKRIWLPLHENFLAYLSTATDLVVVGVLLSAEQLSRYGIAVAIAGVVGTAKALTGAIYPVLLKTGEARRTDLNALFKFQHIFVTPMVAGGIALAPQLVEIFGTRYLDAASVLPYLLFAPAIGLLGLTMKNVLTALESADKNPDQTTLAKSTLFTTQLPGYLYLGILLATTILTVGPFGIIGAAAARLAATIAAFIPILYLYKRRLAVATILQGLEKTVLASLAMMAVLYLINPRGTLFTLATIVVGAFVYFGVLLAIDKDARALTKQIVQEARRMLLWFTE